jgi:hypothetical protein
VSPVLIDLMRRVVRVGARDQRRGLIHDFEIALAGATSEDVDEALGPGRFGMAEETGGQLNAVSASRGGGGRGLGQAVGRHLRSCRPACRVAA